MPDTQEGPTIKVVTTAYCQGCKYLFTKSWTFEGENDDFDSGTDAYCRKDPEGSRNIDSYWNSTRPAPKWCPFLQGG